MNATKRKFNALLQGIGTRSTNSVSSMSEKDHSRASFESNTSISDLANNNNNNDTILSTTTDSTNNQNSSDMLLATPPRPSGTARTATTTMTTMSTSSAVTSLEFLAKRRRIGLSAAPTGTGATGRPGVATDNVVPRKWGTIGGKGGAGNKIGQCGQATQQQLQQQQQQQQSPLAPPAPRYCPGDREQLLRRLATFQELTDWTPKPNRINEIEWAKRGWVCQGKERVRCTLCSKELVVQLRRRSQDGGRGGGGATAAAQKAVDAVETSADTVVPAAQAAAIALKTAETAETAAAAEAALVDTYAGCIVSAHQDDCLWQKKGCDDSLLRLPLASPQQALADLRRRYDELCARKDFLPYEFNLRLPAGLDIDAVLATLPPAFFDPAPTSSASASASSPPQHPNRVALALAVAGWQGLTNSRIGAVPNSASCHACLRRLGLWMFKSKQVDPATNAVLEPAPMDHLDAVREHRFFCPWKNGAVQRNPGGRTGRSHNRSQPDDAERPGWDVLVRVLQNDAYLRNRVTAPNQRPRTAQGACDNCQPAATVTATATATATATTPARVHATDMTATEPPSTPVRQPAAGTDGGDGETAADGRLPGSASGDTLTAEDEAARDVKDKERWARLRRVKSLFDTKGSTAKKLRRMGVGSNGSSRPGTGHSSLRPESPVQT
ncbi:c3hc zinc finger protein [Niveomyces insectorum RCEF 264]|uniref:C3hc zinc finger protein n=1 Tax=Niveomyces insectorum RCEF 264 TaxID=1081102 RepID=A0A167VNW4_9HYPO|nr:c3hc zinc finger protein [Niveomyces insectorum RCEF 264]